jgi:peptidoglycan/xylan/chitin deacetylase (PgdA/CDA1 family)
MNSWTRLSGFIFSKLLSRFPDPVMVSGSSDEQVVALTFDDGPHPLYTQEILDVLDDYQIKGTFFLLGHAVRKHPVIAGEVTAGGHAIGAHTYSHPLRVRRNPFHFEREIVRTHRLIASTTGEKPGLFRPPRGTFDPLLFMAVRIVMGYTVVLWSVSAKDWRKDSAEAIAARVVADIEPGRRVSSRRLWRRRRWCV